MIDHREKIVKILLIDDNEADVDLVREAIEESSHHVDLFTVCDGEEAMNFIYQRDKFSQVARPDLILLDLNLPKKDGREILKEIKANLELKTIPIVILSTSKSEEDIVQSYQLQANCYLTKSVDFEEFSKTISSLLNFWFSLVLLPSNFK